PTGRRHLIVKGMIVNRLGGLACAPLLLLIMGCDLIGFGDPLPERARVIAEGDATASVRLVFSRSFVAGLGEDGITRVRLLQADTLLRILPFDTTYDLRGRDGIFAELSHAGADLSDVRLRVLLDDDEQFDRAGSLEAGAPYRFLYSLGQFVGREVEVL
ncbi:MAG: hypothetical protein ACRELV_16060, partial [Longimicrobiales bacterium]